MNKVDKSYAILYAVTVAVYAIVLLWPVVVNGLPFLPQIDTMREWVLIALFVLAGHALFGVFYFLAKLIEWVEDGCKP